jgi:hypothetical protein
MSLFKGDGWMYHLCLSLYYPKFFIRHILGDEAHPLEVRMGEIFFRNQKITVIEDGIVMGADE